MSLQLIPVSESSIPRWLYIISETVNNLIIGRANNTSTFTLASGATSTVIVDPAFESSQVPCWTPTTAAAATAMTKVYVSSRSKGTFTVTHDNTADTDRTFIYTRWG